jgi:hypothetical protein
MTAVRWLRSWFRFRYILMHYFCSRSKILPPPQRLDVNLFHKRFTWLTATSTTPPCQYVSVLLIYIELFTPRIDFLTWYFFLPLIVKPFPHNFVFTLIVIKFIYDFALYCTLISGRYLQMPHYAGRRHGKPSRTPVSSATADLLFLALFFWLAWLPIFWFTGKYFGSGAHLSTCYQPIGGHSHASHWLRTHIVPRRTSSRPKQQGLDNFSQRRFRYW